MLQVCAIVPYLHYATQYIVDMEKDIHPFLGFKEVDGKSFIVYFFDNDEGVVVQADEGIDGIHLGLLGEFDENQGNVFYTPYFMTRSYNVGARNYYEEFLFDKGSLVFYFNKSQNDETRYYWGAGGFFHEDIKGQKMMDEVFASRLAHDLVEGFNRLMNREY